MATIITLYKQCKITKDRNAKVDNISAYLDGFIENTNKKTFSDCQYQQIELHKTIKLELPQEQVGKDLYNYLDINQDTKHFYYFIDKANWKSTKTVEFECTLDTVNTFADDFTFNKKTHITRQHKDRIKDHYEVIQNYDAWEYPPVNKLVILNPWAYENEMQDIFKIQALADLTSCVIEKRNSEGTVIQSWENITELGQDYVGQSGTAMYFKYHPGMDYVYTVVLEYDTLINDFNNGIYYVIKFVGNVSDLVYTTGWQSLFYGILKHEYIRIVDQKEEGINPPQFKNNEEFKITDQNTPNNNWYLVYKSTGNDDTSAVSCQLWPDLPMQVKVAGSNSFKVSDFAIGTYYYIMPKNGLDGNRWHNTYNFSNGNDLPANSDLVLNVDLLNEGILPCGFCRNRSIDYVEEPPRQYCRWMVLYRGSTDDNHLVIETWRSSEDSIGRLTNRLESQFITNSADSDTIKFSNWVGNGVKYYTTGVKKENIYELYQFEKNNTWTGVSWNFTTTTQQLKSFSTLDRTESTLIKIIKVPYSIVNIDENGRLNNDSWAVDSGHLVLVNKNAKFINNVLSDYNPLDVLRIDAIDEPGDAINRKDLYESKIYNSEFYMPKFVYDSFNYQYLLENVDENEPITDNIIEYQTTSTINSRFLFKFDLPLKRSTSDYDKICVVARNNEVPVYTNAYLNYIRTGYNYDVKNKNANLAKSTVGVVGSAAAGALATGIAITKIGAAAGSTVGPVGTAVGAGVGAVIGLATGLITMAINQSQADNAIKQKLDEASRQATSVEGGDDIDLLDNYTDGNKAKYVIYRCSDKVRQTMLDLFYYCGYSEDVYSVPSINTRKYFNYIECEPVFNEENNSVYKEYLEDIKERYKAGVTVYHNYGTLLAPAYDWAQAKENWETSLL